MMSGKMSIDSSISVNQQPTTNIQTPDCEVCEYCGSPRLIQHSEGFTCLECSRVTLGVYHTDTTDRHTITTSRITNIPRKFLVRLCVMWEYRNVLKIEPYNYFYLQKIDLKQNQMLT